ncbi:hypothetical protein PN441_13855 [Spirulina major CS-329]|uniref:hypothetical protein n=1 Tax=Spirulina TaxID=1154 RepID=UPI00232B0C91|nr:MULTISPECIES: hypothetical protein [Spirulina]MDB9494930.1 hypothetical protein [Spirulina subsalsa CS-330]MDB9504157.1 hypothetical protein [Spirulina major CS-329]
MHDSSGPYQSRLLNAINRARIVWGDRLQRTVRSAQVAAVWGVQVLLYPFYALTQWGRNFSLQLEGFFSPSPPLNLQPADPDTPIQKLLAQVTTGTVWADLDLEAIAPPAQPIRGIASDRTTRSLLLTAHDNSPIALPPAAQQRLDRHIRLELADYAYQNYRRKVQAYRTLIPAALSQDPQIWPPLRRFWAVMRWMQQSPVAIATNLFHENTFFEPPIFPLALPPALTLPPPPSLPSALAKLDPQVVSLETQQATLQARWVDWMKTQTQQEAPSGTLQGLIQSAIAYFFGLQPQPTPLQPPPPPPRQPWLLWEDIPSPSSGFIPSVPRSRSIIDDEMALELYAVEPPHRDPSPLSRLKPPMTSPADDAPAPLRRRESTAAPPDYQPDWLDIPAEPVGYEKHWLEVVLGAFDRLMARVEDAVIGLWRRVRSRLTGGR